MLRDAAQLQNVLVSWILSRKIRIRIYKTLIRPILMYGSKVWTLSLKEENRLLVADRKVLWKILGFTKWLGHVERIGED